MVSWPSSFQSHVIKGLCLTPKCISEAPTEIPLSFGEEGGPATMALTYVRLRFFTTRHSGRCSRSNRWWLYQKRISISAGNAKTCGKTNRLHDIRNTLLPTDSSFSCPVT